MMRKFLAAASILFTLSVNAQWDTLNTGVNTQFRGIAFLNAATGVAVGHSSAGGDGNIALVTNDRGNTWSTYIGSTTSDHEYTDVTFTPGGTIWIIGDSGLYLHTDFPNTNHIADGYLTSWSLFCGTAPNDSTFYCAGEHGVLFSTYDRGLTWNTLSTGTTENINDIYFANAANGWIVGDGAVLKVTSDSGNTWTSILTPQFGFPDYKSLDYQDTVGVNPYLVGSYGSAQFSVDGGLNWFSIATGTNVTLNSIRFGTNNAGIMVGNDAFIYRTDDAGGTWFTDPTTETHADLFDIAYAGDTTALICGDSGVILRSRTDISTVQHHNTLSFSAGCYPNPTNGPVNVQMMLSEQSDITISVLDVAGKLISTEYHENVSAGENVLPLNIQSLEAGFYYVNISNGFSAVTLPVIRQ